MAVLAVATLSREVQPQVHEWERVELTFLADKAYANPNIDVDVWIDLTSTLVQEKDLRVLGWRSSGHRVSVRHCLSPAKPFRY